MPQVEPSGSELGAISEPELSRVSILGGNTQLDIGLPSSVPIAVFMPGLVSLIESRNPDLSEHDDGVDEKAQHWTLARLGQDAIAPNKTLTDAEVFDGELLVLRPVAAKETPALFDDVIDAVSQLSASAFRSWSPSSARWMGFFASVLAVVSAGVLLGTAKSQNAGAAAAGIALLVAIGALIAATIAARMYAAPLTSTVLSLCSVILIFVGITLVVPNGIGSAHLLLGFTATLLAAIVAYRITGVGATMVAATATVSVFGAIASFVVMVEGPALRGVGAAMIAVAVLVISMAPRLAIALARLPLPPVPTAGGAIDPLDHEQRPTVEGIGAIGATALPSASKLVHRARTANQFQSGIVIGAMLNVVLGAVLAADPFGVSRWQGVTLAVIAAIILCLRGRSFADLTQASTLIGGGCVAFVALILALTLGDRLDLVPAAVLLLVFATAAMLFGVAAPTADVSPVVRRFGEITEYILIAMIVPLMFWIMDLYSVMRNL
ncbi:type VII secretion integral membrane protein EccD [Antrihabitans sp. YC3-6]|uniref:Type VII secretion integral membrane protein EccD n=2 Tax=Antrihabitans stalagmiti TaxID=2799499 RepID=A0A934NNM8_9NOCA|nr:type VII secretion integral membrane protein EccD [Antrihabitans stalagmiti]